MQKKWIQGLCVAGIALALVITVVVTSMGKGTEAENETEVAAVEPAKNGMAGISETILEEEKNSQNLGDTITVEKEPVEVVSNPAEEAEKEQTEVKEPEETKEEPEVVAPSEEELEWQDKLMADVKDSMNVREEANAESKIVGKLRKGDRALIKEQGETWTKIASGNVTGYVKNEYCVFGLDALEYAKKNCETVATVTTDALRVRAEADTSAKVIRNVGKGDKLVVAEDVQAKEGWVAVKSGKEVYYVSAEFVKIGLNTTKAVTIEEDRAAKSGLLKGQTNVTSTAPGHTLAASADELTLLACLAECEAGGVSEQAMTAVAAVVINRIHSNIYPNNMYDVIHQRGQFGPAWSGRLEQRLAKGPSAGAVRAAQAALDGADPTNGALGFKLASTGIPGIVIGPIVFFQVR